MANQVKGPTVTVIDPINREKAKLRVAAYARVSSDSADQLNSYLAQVDYYTRHIGENPDWELADIYADEGISGLDTQKRDEFNRMMADCRAGKSTVSWSNPCPGSPATPGTPCTSCGNGCGWVLPSGSRRRISTQADSVLNRQLRSTLLSPRWSPPAIPAT